MESHYSREELLEAIRTGLRGRGFERHELTHVVSLGSWSRSAGPGIVEGLATWVNGRCGGWENGCVTRAIRDRDLLIPAETLAGDFRGQDDLIAYYQAASILEFVVHRLGPQIIAPVESGA